MRAISLARERLDEPVDIVVVDDGDNGNIAELVEPFGARLVQLGPSGSAAIARNRGAKGAAAEEVIVFVDADVEIEPDAIVKLVGPIQQGAAVATVGNYSDDTNGLSFVQSYKQLYIWRIYSRRRGYIENLFWSALCAIKAETFGELGGFEPAFQGACDEDTDLGFRLTRAGMRVMAVPDAKGINLKPYTLRTLLANDLLKGTSTIQLAHRNRVPMSENRHASYRDMLAVFLACAWLASLLVSPVFGDAPEAMARAVLGLGVAYPTSRHDLLRTFARQRGIGFALRAIPLMFLLDLVRAACVARALGMLSYDSARSAFVRVDNGAQPSHKA